MATGDKIVNLDDLKVAYDKLHGDETALDGRVNALHTLVDYAPADYSTDDYKRVGTRLFVNHTFSTSSTAVQTFRLNGTLATTNSNSSVDALTNPIKLSVGHKYRMTSRQMSGTLSNGSGAVINYLAYPIVYTAGGHTAATGSSSDLIPIAVNSYAADFVYTQAMDTAGGVQLCLRVNRSAGAIFTNWVGQITLEDITKAGDENIAPVEGVTAANTYNSGELVLSAGTLYKATANIGVSDAIASYATKTTIAAQIAALEVRIAALEAANT